MFAEVIEVMQETPDTKTLRIRPDNPIDFIPGQFIMVGLEIPVDGKKKLVQRAYSIASSPTQRNYMDITFNVYPEGQFSPHMYRLKPGEKLHIEGPYGKFIFKGGGSGRAVFLGAGAGLTPLMSMIRYIFDKGLHTKSALLYSARKPENIIYHKELIELEKKGLKLSLTMTRPEGTGWTGMTGRIDKEKIQKLVDDSGISDFYICGPPEMVEGTVNALKELGVGLSKINREQW